MNAITERLKEKSTWAGIVAVLSAVFGFALAPEHADTIAAAAAGVAGVALVLIRERKDDHGAP